MSELQATFERLGLQEYLSRLVEHGFDSWDNLAGINETDMEAIGIKLGHRRRLQQETARQLGDPAKELLVGLEAAVPQASGQDDNLDVMTNPHRPKRRYRRRPLRDSNAPTRPDTAYVAYTRSVRQEAEIAKLSFAEIAKVIGTRWSRLSSEEKDMWNQNAAAQRSIYNGKLEQYYQTEAYQIHRSNCAPKNPREDQWEAEVDYNDALTKEFCTNNVSGVLSDTGKAEDESSANSFEGTRYTGSESTRGSSTSSSTTYMINDTQSPLSRYSSSRAASICESNKSDLDGPAIKAITTIIPQGHLSKSAALPRQPNLENPLPHNSQRSAVSRSFHVQTINPFDFQTRADTLPIIDSFLQSVNTVYHLVNPDELRKNLDSVLDTSHATHNLIMSIVCLCLALGHQNSSMDMADSAIMWYENGRRYLDDCDWRRDLAAMQALALISIFHISQRPATSSQYLDNAIRIGEANNLHKAAEAERGYQASHCRDGEWLHIWKTIQTMYRYHQPTSLLPDSSG